MHPEQQLSKLTVAILTVATQVLQGTAKIRPLALAWHEKDTLPGNLEVLLCTPGGVATISSQDPVHGIPPLKSLLSYPPLYELFLCIRPAC